MGNYLTLGLWALQSPAARCLESPVDRFRQSLNLDMTVSII